MGRCFLSNDLVGDLLTPGLFKDKSIDTPWQVIYPHPANAVGSGVGRGNLRPARTKLRKRFAVLALIWRLPH